MERNDFNSAAAAIASECAARRWDQSVTTADTLGWVNADSTHDWINDEVGLRSPQSILADVCAQLTDAQALSVLHALGHDNDAVHEPLLDALEYVVAREMVTVARALIDNCTRRQDYAEAAADAAYERRQEQRLEAATDFSSLEKKLSGGVFGAIGLRP